MAQQTRLFQRLTSLFRSGPVVKRKIQGFRTGEITSSALDVFRKSTAGIYGNALNAYGQYDRLSRYSDFSEMEYTPEIASAVDIHCLAGNNEIPLLDGTTKTIKELFDSGLSNFWLYSFVIDQQRFVPGLCKAVAKTGENQTIYRVLLDDGSYMRLTAEHKVLLSDGTYKKVKDLSSGDSLRALYRKLSTKTKRNRIEGYEMVLQPTTGWQYTHRMVFDYLDPGKKGVCHHKNCIKLDNTPENLEKMSWEEHQLVHRTLNSLRWKNDKAYAQKMSKIFSDHAKKMNADPVWRAFFMKRRDETFASYDEKTRKDKFGRSGSQNGMYGSARFGDLNPRWRDDYVREFDKDTVIKLIMEDVTINEASKILNTRLETLREWCQENGIQKWHRKYVRGVEYKDVIDYFKARTLSADKSVSRSFKEFCMDYGITTHVGYEALYEFGYKNWKVFIASVNHKVVSVEEDGVEDVYDLCVEGFHNFVVGMNNGFVVVHNSEEAVAPDDKGRSVHIYSDNPKIQQLLEELFYDTLNVEFNLKSWVRNLCKYGDFFIFNDVSPEYGVINAFPIPVNEIEREEGWDPNDPLAVRFRWVTQGNQVLENWQVTHFRLLGNDAFLPYGSSILESARRIWRQLILIEDAMLVYRVIRAPERRVFYIDVANVPPADVPNVIDQVRARLKSQEVIDKDAGRVDLRYNPWSVDIDYFLAVRGGETGTKIDTLPGGQNTTAIDDVEYIQRKLFAALKVPKAYLGFDEQLSSKANLAQEDVRFARTVNAIQRVIISELNKMATIHLFANGFEDDDLLDFTIQLSNPSTVAMQQKLEIVRTRFEIASSKPEFMLSTNWIYKNVFNMTDTEIREDEELMVIDRRRMAELDAMGEGGEPGAGGGFGGGGEFGGPEPGGLEGLGGEEGGEFDLGGEGGPPGEEGEEEEEGGEEEEDLFAGEEEEKDNLLLDDEEPFELDEDEDEESKKKKRTPIKPQNLSQIQRFKHNHQRRVHGGGRSQTVMPDLAGMNQAKAFSDIHDKRFMNNPFGEGSDNDGDVLSSMVAQQHRMSKQLERTLNSMKRDISIDKDKKSVLTEEVDELLDVVFVEEIDPEDLIIEHKLDPILSKSEDGDDNGET